MTQSRIRTQMEQQRDSDHDREATVAGQQRPGGSGLGLREWAHSDRLLTEWRGRFPELPEIAHTILGGIAPRPPVRTTGAASTRFRVGWLFLIARAK